MTWFHVFLILFCLVAVLLATVAVLALSWHDARDDMRHAMAGRDHALRQLAATRDELLATRELLVGDVEDFLFETGGNR